MCYYVVLTVLLCCICSVALENDIQKLLHIVQANIDHANNYNLSTDNHETLKSNSTETIEYGEFHFIIVGGGTAGCVLANRLSRNSKWRILLLEAGDEDNAFSEIPGMTKYLLKSKMNWGYYTTPQASSCQGMMDKRCAVPRGKVLGGSGTINDLIYSRGSQEDYDYWEKLGNTEWSYKDLEKYYLELELWQTYGNRNYHGFHGSLNCNRTKPDSVFLTKFFAALAKKGHRQIDYNVDPKHGVSRTVFNINFNKRVTAFTSFVKNITNRSNLIVSKNSLVTKLLIDSKMNRTNGVKFIRNNVTYIAICTKEVILSAGSINTPQILMLSGIGPKEVLALHKIPVVKNLPVGKNLQEHPKFIGLIIKTNLTEHYGNMSENLRKYFYAAKPLTSTSPESIGFLKFKQSHNDTPEIEYLMNPAEIYDNITKFKYNFNKNIDEFMTKSLKENAFVINLILLHGKSRGQITLKSNDPKDFPQINLNMLSVDEDVKIIYRAIKYFIDLLNTEPMRKMAATLLPPNTICGNYKSLSKKYWYCVIKQLTVPANNLVGTTRMGLSSNYSVVNHQLKVHGIENLRVVDAGIMPEIISGHTNAPTFVIALKTADSIILENSV